MAYKPAYNGSRTLPKRVNGIGPNSIPLGLGPITDKSVALIWTILIEIFSVTFVLATPHHIQQFTLLSQYN